jgi:AraC-like DNA-binding protein
MARCQASRGDLAVIGVLTAAAETRVLAADAVRSLPVWPSLDRDLPAEEIANRVGLSPRQLHHLCVDRFGLPPSVLRRTSRLHRAARLYQAAGPGRRLADLAQAAG